MPDYRSGWLLVVAMVCASCMAEPRHSAAAPPIAGYRSVLIAGDGSLPVFDNAVAALAERLATPPVHRLTSTRALAARTPRRAAWLSHVLTDISTLRPEAGQGCFVFATSHGAAHRGLWLSLAHEFLTPVALDRALTEGCGDAPTVVVISSCFSGSFARAPMTRANRIILTAARPDRTSFGCGAGRVYTVFDQCLLAAFDAGGPWRHAYESVKSCVAQEEQVEQVVPSEPQAWFGTAVGDLALPTRKE
jgi:hypothetical protein